MTILPFRALLVSCFDFLYFHCASLLLWTPLSAFFFMCFFSIFFFSLERVFLILFYFILYFARFPLLSKVTCIYVVDKICISFLFLFSYKRKLFIKSFGFFFLGQILHILWSHSNPSSIELFNYKIIASITINCFKLL